MKKLFYLIVFAILVVALAGLEMASARLPVRAPETPRAIYGGASTAY